MGSEHLIVVGGSLAGLRAAEAGRAAGLAVTVVGDEHRMPYSRPPLSKEVLVGERDAASCAFPGADLDVTWRLGDAAVALDPDNRTVALSSGVELCYDRVIVATGSRPRPWTGDGGALPEVLTFRGVDDAIRLRGLLASAKRVAIVGAGFLGAEIASSAARLGLSVTLTDIATTFMPALGEHIGKRLVQLHAAHGVELLLGVGVEGIVGTKHVQGLQVEDGDVIPADIVVVAIGAVPNTEWLTGSGLHLDATGGVRCDETLTVLGHQDVLCAGDVTAWPHSLGAERCLRVEHWTNADEQGTHAGQNAATVREERVQFDSLPYFWTDQHGVKVQAVGYPEMAESFAVAEGDVEGERFVVVGIRHGRVVAALAWNAMRRLPVYQKAVEDRATHASLLAGAGA
jgi:3-phenylpropionate/trans-cinnamate dioxygenase ferredoxin reductase component